VKPSLVDHALSESAMGLAVVGPQGVGKTTLACAALRSALVAVGEGHETAMPTLYHDWSTPFLGNGERHLAWNECLMLLDTPGVGGGSQQAGWAASGVQDATVALVVCQPSSAWTAAEREVMEGAVSFSENGRPIVLVMNAIDSWQVRNALSVEEETESTRRRLARDYGLRFDAVVAVSARDALVAHRYLGAARADRHWIEDELDLCLRRSDGPTGPRAVHRLLVRSNIAALHAILNEITTSRLAGHWARIFADRLELGVRALPPVSE
jgi:hypothetical protein